MIRYISGKITFCILRKYHDSWRDIFKAFLIPRFCDRSARSIAIFALICQNNKIHQFQDFVSFFRGLSQNVLVDFGDF